MYRHWSSRLKHQERAQPSVASKAARRQITKAKPGTPSMHLFDDEIEEVDADARQVDRDRAEGAHGVDDERLAELLGHLADGLDRIEHAAGGLAVDDHDVRDGRIGRQGGPHVGGRRRLRLRILERRQGDRLHGGHLGDPLAVGPVDQHQQLALRGRDGSHHRFQPERSAALHEHGLVALLLGEAGHGQQRLPHAGHDRAELAVPRAHVAEHGLLDRLAGGQWTGREQQQVAGGKRASGIGHDGNLAEGRLLRE